MYNDDYGATGNVVREFQKNIFLTIKGNKIPVYIDCVVFLHFDRMIGQITSSHKEHVGTTCRLIMSPWRPMDGAKASKDRKLERFPWFTWRIFFTSQNAKARIFSKYWREKRQQKYIYVLKEYI